MNDSNKSLLLDSTLQNGKYVIKSVLGQGGFGITYLAEHTMLDVDVAIKEFFPKTFCDRDTNTSHIILGTSANKELVERFKTKFIKEARNIARLKHPGIVRIQDVFEENNTAYYVMDYIAGQSLSDIVKQKGKIDIGTAIEWITKAGDALSYIHSKNINHLDIKPANIMIDSIGNPILIDFGLAKQYDDAGKETSTTPVGISRGYASPEQYSKGGVSSFSPQADIYSLAATLYKLITGVTPPEAMALLDIELEFPDFIDKNTALAISNAMSMDKKQRTSKVEEFTSIIKAVQDQVNVEATEISITDSILSDWDKILALSEWEDGLIEEINHFIQKYSMNQTDTAWEYIKRAKRRLERITYLREERKDWIESSNKDSILGYIDFIHKNPYSQYREEAEARIQNMKDDVISHMKKYPLKFSREEMYNYISSNALSYNDLVNSGIITDRAYEHIKHFPTVRDEQLQFQDSLYSNPKSEDGNIDIYFIGVEASGKSCILSGMLTLIGKLGFGFDPKMSSGSGNYAIGLKNYALSSTLPPDTTSGIIQVIHAYINDENDHLNKISLIEMCGEKTASLAALDTFSKIDDLGETVSKLLTNDNNKIFFFVIDPTCVMNVEMGIGSQQWVRQSDILNCILSLFSKSRNLMKNVIGINVIVTKTDVLGDYFDNNKIQEVLKALDEQGYNTFLNNINNICGKYGINKQTDSKTGLYSFSIGKFMPGDVYTFDDTDSFKILKAIRQNIVAQSKETFFRKVSKWLIQ